jgi:hypothetical protein
MNWWSSKLLVYRISVLTCDSYINSVQMTYSFRNDTLHPHGRHFGCFQSLSKSECNRLFWRMSLSFQIVSNTKPIDNISTTYCVDLVDRVFPKLHSHFTNLWLWHIFTNRGQFYIESSDRVLSVSQFCWKERYTKVSFIISLSICKIDMNTLGVVAPVVCARDLPNRVFTISQSVLYAFRAHSWMMSLGSGRE